VKNPPALEPGVIGSGEARVVSRKLRIAVIGGGIGGLTAALALSRCGFETHIFEQADALREVGAGLGISPNAFKVLRALGLEAALRTRGFEPDAITGRDWATGDPSFRIPLKEVIASRHGAPLINIHRADLLDILAATCERECCIHLGSYCSAVMSADGGAVVAFRDGTQEGFDVVAGCDGIHSRVRAMLGGRDVAQFTGNVCWRALIRIEALPPRHVAPNVTLWAGPGGHVVTYYVRHGALINLVAIRETPDWIDESWSIESNRIELLDVFPEVHPELRAVLQRVEHCFKWGLFDHDPLPTWGSGHITLLGDAAHPMLPFIGQGAAMAIEDAYVLARELARRPASTAAALRAYEAERIPRTTQVQLAARKQAKVLHRHVGVPQFKPDWLYSYDPTCAPASPSA
jgi:salicylate hydroxylase